MRFCRNAAFIASLLGVLMSFNGSASAQPLTKGQWFTVCAYFWGLRSGAGQQDTGGAGYGMNNGNQDPKNCLKDPPANWNQLLANTIVLIKGFPDSGTRYLLIVDRCNGSAPDYPDAFPKCPRVTGGVQHATPATLANYNNAQLVAWVVANIPDAAARQGSPFDSIVSIPGLYHTSQNRNTCINNPYQSTTNGTQIVVNQHCDYKDPASMWILAPTAGTPPDTGSLNNIAHKCMDNKFGNQSNGNPIVIWDCNGGPTQNWDWDGFTFHWHYNTSKCVSVKWNNPNNTTDGSLILSDCDGSSNQKFTFTSPPGGTGGGIVCGKNNRNC